METTSPNHFSRLEAQAGLYSGGIVCRDADILWPVPHGHNSIDVKPLHRPPSVYAIIVAFAAQLMNN